MSYEKELFNEVIYVAAGKLSPNDSADLLEWVESLEIAKRKADEYEAKAVAFDRIKAYSDKAINGDIHSLILAEGIIDVVEQYDVNRLSESGESDV